jgi:Ca2+-binding EF-hand superfamily protein
MQLMEIREVFDTFDSDGGGTIDVDELRAAMKVPSSKMQQWRNACQALFFFVASFEWRSSSKVTFCCCS